MNTCWPARRDTARRRGMLLLLVLSMLTLFVLMGALAIVIATRARDTARVFANAGGGSGGTPAIAEAMTNEALLLLIRGSKDPVVNTLLRNDSLLKDMYGTQGRGRFVDERYDAFDDANNFLTQLTLDANGRVTAVPRPAFADRNAPCTVDNDGDGVLDGVWVSSTSTSGTNILPQLTLADGKTLSFRVSYLVLDLDGKINVNAHGKRSDAPGAGTGEVGPADVDGSSLLTSPVWNLLMSGTGGQLLTGTISPSNQWRPAPPISSPVDGRFGNLKSGANNETDTYKLRLDLDAQRPASLANATGQNPFTLGELERVLRQFDADASTLPARLTGILHDRAERTRLRVTTDSWETPGDRTDISWEAPNSGRPLEQAFFTQLCQRIATQLYPNWNVSTHPDRAKLQEVEQWVANIVEFRDKDTSNPQLDRLTGGKVTGVEPADLARETPPLIIPGGPVGWDNGRFLSYAQVLGVPKGSFSEIVARRNNVAPPVNSSLAIDTPELLEFLMVPTLFKDTYWQVYVGPGDPGNIPRSPQREPGRINVNTCEQQVWEALLGQSQDNPFDNTPSSAATSTGLLLRHSLVFGGDTQYKAESVNHDVANRLANAATVRSHVFAVWITLEVRNSDTPDQPTYHRLFAIVDRSLPVTFTAATEGQTTDQIRSTIRLQRFLN